MYFKRKRREGIANLALVWCLKTQSVTVVDAGTEVALVCSLQDGPAEGTAIAAALDSGCCSAAAI